MPSHQRLDGRVAVVTGAGSGIGRATALSFAALGAHVIAGGRRTERLEDLCGRIAAEGGSAEYRALDVADAESSGRFAAAVLAAHARLDILVNSAGLARGLTPVVDADEQDWREMIEANVMGLMRMTRLFLPRFIEQQRGDIVHVGSVAGLQPYPQGAAYCASKAAVEAFVQALRLELVGTNIRQLIIEPGMVETEFSLVRFHGDAERAARVYEGVEPLTADDVAECITFFATRPPHFCIQSMLVMPTAQAAAQVVARREKPASPRKNA